MWFAVLIIGLAAAGHQAWSANIFTTVSDMFPKKTVGSIYRHWRNGWCVRRNADMQNLQVYYSIIIKHWAELQKPVIIISCFTSFADALMYLPGLLMHLLVPKMKRAEI